MQCLVRLTPYFRLGGLPHPRPSNCIRVGQFVGRIGNSIRETQSGRGWLVTRAMRAVRALACAVLQPCPISSGCTDCVPGEAFRGYDRRNQWESRGPPSHIRDRAISGSCRSSHRTDDSKEDQEPGTAPVPAGTPDQMTGHSVACTPCQQTTILVKTSVMVPVSDGTTPLS